MALMKSEFLQQLSYKMKKENNVLIVLPTDSIGGAERVAQNLTSHLVAENYKVYIFFLSKGDTGSWNEFKKESNVELFFSESKSEASGLFSFFKWCLCSKTSLKYAYSTHLHVNALVGFTRLIRLLKIDNHIARESTVIFDRFFGLKKYIFKFLYKFYFNVDLLIFQTEYMKKRLIYELPNIKKIKNKVIRNPLNLNKIDNLAAEQVELSNCFNILFVGRVIPLKNLKLLIDSLAFFNKNSSEQFHCYVLGAGSQKLEMIKLVENYNLSSNFSFLGNVKNPYKYMSHADLGVITSLKEGFPNVIIEMMAAGTKTIITTPCAGDLEQLPEVIVTDDFSVVQLASCLKYLITNNPDHSDSYRAYANSINTNSFWNKIESNL